MFSERSYFRSRRIILTAGFLSFAIILVGCAGLATSSSSGSITQAGVVVSPGSFNFKNVTVGQTIEQTMRISNTSKAPVQISALAISNKQFALSGPSVPRSILPGQSAQYTVSFTPTTAGSVSSSISISDDASPTPMSVSLSGTGEKNSAALQLTPSSINFGNLAVKSTNIQNVTLQNTGSVSVSINGVSVVGSGFGYSDLSPGYSLSPNQKVTFQVWFKPQVSGAAKGTLSILAANMATPAVASLSGDGTTSGGSSPPPSASAHTVHLTWNASTSSTTGYRVYRSDVSGGPYSSVNGSNVDALSFDDSSVASGNTYYYVVTAVNSSGEESVYSNQTAASIPTP